MLWFERDSAGQEVLLKEGKFQVMMEWERPYMEACIDALTPHGDVLEVGFGLGYAATHIQSYHPNSHTIVECDSTVIQKAKKWRNKHPDSSICLVETTWQQALHSLGKFDIIFFDDYPLPTTEELKQLDETKKSIAKQENLFFKTIHKMLPMLTKIRYTEADLQAFIDHVPIKERGIIPTFLELLRKEGNITEALFAKFYPKESPTPRKTMDRLRLFLEACLQHHMRPNARFSCFIENPTSKRQDPAFQWIFDNPHLHYEESWIPVSPPPHCNYYQATQALVIVITLI